MIKAGTRTEMIEDVAARWAIRLGLDDRPLSAGEQAALNAWLAADQRHLGALLRAQATLAYVDRGLALSPGGACLQDPEVRETDAGTSRRRFMQLAGGSAAAVSAGLGTAFFLRFLRGEQIHTDIGEIRRVSLADGSVAVVNTSSRLAVALGADQRAIRLDEGEAWFQVAHDKARPFVVEAGPVRVRALGTAFSVRRHGDAADVLVTEGVVEAWTEGDMASRRRLVAGTKASVSAMSASNATIPDAADELERALAWRDGEIALNGETVAFAVDELNRYNRKPKVIVDAAIGQERLVGAFRTNDPAEFAHAVVQMTGAQRVDEGNEIRLTRR